MENKKRLLLLGGSMQQVPAIIYARNNGYTTILCDFLEDNPGQNYADRFYCVSTTDKEMILRVAQKEQIDGIVAYASDPAAPTAAFVAEKMGLPTNPFDSVEILAFKDKFRDFLKENGFNCPLAKSFACSSAAIESVNLFKLPVMVKPIDSSGSKGVVRVDSIKDIETAIENAFSHSRNGRIIIEEYTEMNHEFMIGGDCFIENGKIEFLGLLNCHRDRDVNPLVPVGKSYPLQSDNNRIEKIRETVQKIVDILSINFGCFNLELMFDENDDLYVIEMGPRNGGNMIPDLLHMATGFDMIAATIEAALGKNVKSTLPSKAKATQESFMATHNIHTAKSGLYKGLKIDEKIKKHILKSVIYKEKGEPVYYFDGANKAVGIIFMEFSNSSEMFDILNNINSYIEVIVE